MKKFIIRILIFVSIVSITDVCFGFACEFLQKNTKGGHTWRDNYIVNHTNEDILIFGSSRAVHHYNPIILQDSLDMSCYNCGQEGNGILLSYGRLQMINERYMPKIIIYDLTQSFDLLTGEDNHKYLTWLRPYYYTNPEIDTIFWDIDKTERLKMLSRMFQYNSKFIQIASDRLNPLQNNGIQGFRPMNGKILFEHNVKEEIEFEYDYLKIRYLKMFIQATRGKSKLIFTVSPSYKKTNTDAFALVREICKQQDILFLDYYCDPEISPESDYFYDSVHLNSMGADVFTKKLVRDIAPKIGFYLSN